jgi:eukaryotic-like serine/threonine-protein kinase
MPKLNERSIFQEAIEFDDASRRSEFVKKACGEDLDLRASVEELLAAHESTDDVLDRQFVTGHPIDFSPALSSSETHSDAMTEHIGTLVGSFRLMEQIGEGGFGLVFVAQQEHPVKRKVALKLIKPGTGSKEVIARFELERQSLAMMDHPNIARVFDAGVTEDGRPYFVMELVRGLPITDYCDTYQLCLENRVRLFQDVCAAVQHAHQKGVIHRDLKPSNVMVTLHDDKAVVKVIDFGVAKAIGDNLTEKTIYTRFYSMIRRNPTQNRSGMFCAVCWSCQRIPAMSL